jgi:hypothetical protein
MAGEAERLGLLIDLHELALTRLFETAAGGAEAKALFVADVRRLLAATRTLQPEGPAARTYEALLRRLGATAGDPDLAVSPTPEQGLPPSGPGA